MPGQINNMMVIYSGTDDPELSAFIQSFLQRVREWPLSLTDFNLDQLGIRSCLGCYVCQMKTPGCCVIQDAQARLLQTFIASDKVILVVPLVQGFMSGRTKTFIDRLYPLELPYIRIADGSFTHSTRYPVTPKLGFVLHPEACTDSTDLEINLEINRFIGDFYGGFAFQRTTFDAMEDIIHDTVRV